MKNLTLTAGDIGDAGSFAGLEDPLKEGTATHSTILSWRIPWSGAWRSIVNRAANSWTQQSDLAYTHARIGYRE